jgi:hypothetical protein
LGHEDDGGILVELRQVRSSAPELLRLEYPLLARALGIIVGFSFAVGFFTGPDSKVTERSGV